MDRQDLKFKPNFIHKEDIGDQNYINNATTDIVNDIQIIDTKMIDYANKFKILQEGTKIRLESIKRKLAATRDIQQDINILCNKYSSFASVVNITSENSKTNLLWEDGILSLSPTSSVKSNIEVTTIDGNGYEGNKYVLINDDFIDEMIDTKSYGNITDGAISTSFEYSRITSNDEGTPAIFNKDSIEAECAIEIKAEKSINKINISSDRKDLVLREILLSDDGIIYNKYKDCNLKINDRDERYNNPEYIFASGLIAISPSKYIKLIFRSSAITNETIAYVKTITDTSSEEIIQKIVVSNKSKRHLVKINDITAYKNKYAGGSLVTGELVDSPISCIALLANEYTQEGYTADNNVLYFLIINGIEHKVIPLNSHRNGLKIIRVSANNYNAESIEYLTEDIKSVKLKVILNTPNVNMTPYLSDLKLLIGGE